MTNSSNDLIFGRTWEEIKNLQQKKSSEIKIDTSVTGDYGADPVGDGTFKMIPSGDIVTFEERNKRLSRYS